MTARPVRTVDDLHSIASAYRRCFILLTANHLGIFSAIGGSNYTAHQVAERLNADHRAIQILLDALASLGLLAKRGSFYSNSTLANNHLIPGCPGYIGNILHHNFHLVDRWRQLSHVVRTGQPAARQADEQAFSSFLRAMADLAKDGAQDLLKAHDFSEVRSLLDLGGGPGVYAVEICRKYRDLRAVVFDLPAAQAIAEETVSSAGLGNRITFRAGDYLNDQFGGPYDAILLSSIIHSLGEREIQLVLRKCGDVLTTGGQVLIRDFFLQDDQTHPVENALFAVNMLVATPSGRCYAWSQVDQWLHELGFEKTSRKWLGTQRRAGLLVGFRP